MAIPGESSDMTAIETANVDVDTVTLKPGETHAMRAHVTIEALS